MMENNKKYIAVKVCGNPQSNAGYMPLMVLNNPDIDLPDPIYNGVKDNSYFFIICIQPRQVVYKIVKNRVSSYRAAREGALQIAFSIPKGFKLANATPYDVLTDLLKTFLSKSMNCRNKDTQAYEYSSERVDQHVLDETALQYEIIPSDGPWCIMAPAGPIGYIQRSEDQIESLLKDVQYTEFEQYKEIVIAESVDSPTPELSNLQVPRKPKYKICVDGNFQKYQDNIEVSNTATPNINPNVANYYTVTPITFTIKELLEGSVVGGVTIDAANETINVSTAGCVTAKKETVYITFKAKDKKDEEKAADIRAMGVYCGSTRFSVNKDNGRQCFVLSGEQIAHLAQCSSITVSATPIPNLEIDPTPTFDYANKTLTWSFEVKEPEPMLPDVPALDNTHIDTKGKPNYTFELLLKINADGECGKLIKNNNLLIEHDPSRGKVWVMNTNTLYAVSQRGISFKQETINLSGNNKPKASTSEGRGRGENAGKGESVNIQDNTSDPNESAATSPYIYSLSVSTPKGKVAPFEIELTLAGQKYKGTFTYYPGKDKGCKTLTVDRDLKKVPTKLMPSRWMCGIAGFVLCLIIWLLSSLMEHGLFREDPIQIDTTATVTTDTAHSTGNNAADCGNFSITPKQAKVNLTNFVQELKKNDVTFQKVDDIYSQYLANSTLYKSIDINMCNTIETYKDIADKIRKHKYEDIKETVGADAGRHLPLTTTHTHLLLRICSHKVVGKDVLPYSPSETEQARQNFMNCTFNSFKDLDKIFPRQDPPKNSSEGEGEEQEHR